MWPHPLGEENLFEYERTPSGDWDIEAPNGCAVFCVELLVWVLDGGLRGMVKGST